jgi:hypothetical protein
MRRLKKLFQFFITSVVDLRGVSQDILLFAFVGLVLNKNGFDKSFGVIFTPTGTLGCYDEPFSQFDKEVQSLTEKEKQLLLTRADELQEYQERRNNGSFYTPLKFVEMAHSILASRLGDDWKEKYVVFDGAAGSRNLTKGYSFWELYSSTLDNQDVMMYPPAQGEGEFFQFDFLNDDDSKLPQGLQNALKQNKPILFFMNPPYFDGKRLKTLTAIQYHAQQMGISRMVDLSSLFFVRILLFVQKYHLTNAVFAVFCPISYLVSSHSQNLRKLWRRYFKLDRAVLFSARHFVDVTQNWAIHFALWTSGQNPATSEFKHICVDVVDNEIVKIGKKVIYNFDTTDPNYPKLTIDWFNCPLKEPTRFMPSVTSQFKIISPLQQNRIISNSRVSVDHVGSLFCAPILSIHSTAVICNQPGFLLNSSNVGNVEVTSRNFERAVAVFVVANTLEHTWLTRKDHLYQPNTCHPKWQQFVADSVVYSLFFKGSDLISFYDAEYYGQLYDIPNEFFWTSIENMEKLAKKYQNEKTLYSLQKLPAQRFVYKWLREHIDEISEEAASLLDAGNKLLRNTFKYRIDFDKERPELQIGNWDAGWWQLKELWKSVDKSGFKELTELRKVLKGSLYLRSGELGWFR